MANPKVPVPGTPYYKNSITSGNENKRPNRGDQSLTPKKGLTVPNMPTDPRGGKGTTLPRKPTIIGPRSSPRNVRDEATRKAFSARIKKV